MTELAFHGINTSRQKAKSVTHVSGTKCHLCLRPLTAPLIARRAVCPITTMTFAPANSQANSMLPRMSALAQVPSQNGLAHSSAPCHSFRGMHLRTGRG
jgi:hypothetical protein